MYILSLSLTHTHTGTLNPKPLNPLNALNPKPLSVHRKYIALAV